MAGGASLGKSGVRPVCSHIHPTIPEVAQSLARKEKSLGAIFSGPSFWLGREQGLQILQTVSVTKHGNTWGLVRPQFLPKARTKKISWTICRFPTRPFDYTVEGRATGPPKD